MPDYKEARELVIEEVTHHKYYNDKTGKFYSQFIQALASDSCIIGYHHCGFIQSWQTPQRKTYTTRSGFINPFGEAYKIFTERVTQTNLQINARRKSQMRNEEKGYAMSDRDKYGGWTTLKCDAIGLFRL